MRRLLLIASSLLLPACATGTNADPPPPGRLYYPAGLLHVDAPGSDAGVLFVTNANTDKRYSSASLVAINLDGVVEADGGAVGLPAFGAPVAGGARRYVLGAGVSRVSVSSFTGELARLPLGPTTSRLFVPSRSEGMRFQAVDADVSDPSKVKLTCFPRAPEASPEDCQANAPSLSPAEFENSPEGVPRANQPFGVGVKPRTCSANADCGAGRTCSAGACLTATGEPFADVFVTHIQQADSPLQSGRNLRSYVLRLDSDQLKVDASSFINVGTGATNSVAAGRRWAYVSGRFLSPYPNLLRLVDPAGNVLTSLLESTIGVADARGITVGTNERRVYLVTRSPDLLLVVGVLNPGSDFPGLQAVRAVPLPNAPNELKLIPRPGRGDLVAVTCSGAGALALYDEDVGGLVAQVDGIGSQPFAIDADLRGAGARLFVSNFNDGQVAVIDVPDLDRPQAARLVALVGESQLCLTRAATTAGCPGSTP